jgi:hypothetical protein
MQALQTPEQRTPTLAAHPQAAEVAQCSQITPGVALLLLDSCLPWVCSPHVVSATEDRGAIHARSLSKVPVTRGLNSKEAESTNRERGHAEADGRRQGHGESSVEEHQRISAFCAKGLSLT